MVQKVNKIYFRADGDKTIGLGHVIRSLALAEMLHQHYECYFMTNSNLSFVESQILKICQAIIQLPPQENLPAEAQYIQQHYLQKGAIIVIDGYKFTYNYQKILKKSAQLLIAIDDIYSTHFLADIIINHSGAVKKTDYQTASYTQLYLGTSYALLRKPFRQLKRIERSYETQNNIFICFGGADPKNHTLSTIKKLENHSQSSNYFVVIGGAYGHRYKLETYIQSNNLPIKLLSNLTAQEMVNYMKKCSIAITPPSSISYEYLSVGGHLFLEQIADNQDNIKQFLIAQKLAFNLQDFGKVTTKDLADSLTNQQVHFDGKQAKRFLKIIHATQINLRTVVVEDCQQIYDWANHPSVRLQSFNSAPIPFKNHQKWFSNKLTDKNCHFFIGELNGIPFGTIRFDVKENIATISYSVAEHFRGQGLGTLLLKIGKKKLIQSGNSLKEIVGFVKKQNKASQFAFLKLGYLQTVAYKPTQPTPSPSIIEEAYLK